MSGAIIRVRFEDLPEVLRQHIVIDPQSGCWETQKTFKSGYGRLWWQSKTHRAHRLVWKLLVGPIPPKLTLDHVKARGCESKACCFPEHMEPVTSRVNIMRAPNTLAAINVAKTHCPKKHAYTPGNTKIYNGQRRCRACETERSKMNHATGYQVHEHTVDQCREGHKYTPENTIMNTNGGRICKTCRNAKRKIRRAAARANSGPGAA